MKIRLGRRTLNVTTDDVGIVFRWEHPPARDLRVIDGEIVARKELTR